LTAVGRWNESRKPDSREGLLRAPDAQVELFFVTLDSRPMSIVWELDTPIPGALLQQS
jgi:hypothetical protein